MTDYPFKTPPHQHQLDCLKVSQDRKVFANFMQMGCGKSKVIIDNAGYLFLKNEIQGQVVIAPKGVYLNWVEEELPKHMSDAVPHQVAYWSSYAKKEERDAIKKLYREGNFLRTLVINVEAMNSERAVKELVDFMKKFPSMVTVDESTTIKNPRAKRTKSLLDVGKFAKYRRICSGNPIPNGCLDLYSQSEFLQKNILGFQNYFAFRNRFCVMQDGRGTGGSFRQVVGFRDKELLKQLMSRFSFIIKKEDCLDLPPKVYQVVDIQMGPEQTLAYNKMLNESFIQLSDCKVSAQMVVTQLIKLHQIACGFLKPDDNLPEVPFNEPNERLGTLLEVLEQAPGKVIIWATYRHNIKQIIAAISEKFGKETVVDFYGDTDDDSRRSAKKSFQNPESPVKYMISNPDTGKWGNTWTQATTVVYYSNNYNLEAREQSEDRAHRIGQDGAIHKPGEDPSVLYVDLRVRGTVDDRILRTLKAKKKLSDEIVQSNWKWLLGEAA